MTDQDYKAMMELAADLSSVREAYVFIRAETGFDHHSVVSYVMLAAAEYPQGKLAKSLDEIAGK